MSLYLHSLVLWDCYAQHVFLSRVALNPGLGGVRDIASAIISHEQTQYTVKLRLLFQTLDAVFPKDLFSDYLAMRSIQVPRMHLPDACVLYDARFRSSLRIRPI